MKTADLKEKRSDCPVNFAVEALGDKWSLLILRDIIFWGKHTYGEFLRSDERIATNILGGRLEYLEKEGLVVKTPHPTDKRKDLYNVTEKGIGLVPMLIEMIAWSSRDEAWQAMDHSTATPEQIALVRRTGKAKNRAKLIKEVKKTVRSGKCVFEGIVRPQKAAW